MVNARVMFVGGGTGGHFHPLIAVAEALNKTGNEVKLYYIGPNQYNEKSLSMNNITYLWCPSGKMRRYFSVQNFFDIFKVLGGILIALIQLFRIYPDVIFSKGGYTSIPIIIAARLLRIPIIVHESDVRPGKANALALPFANMVAVSYPDSLEYIKKNNVVLTGIPIRQALLDPIDHDTPLPFPVDSTVPLILILGGSQGAERINSLILDSLDELTPKYTIIHQTGESSFAATSLAAKELMPDLSLHNRYYPIALMGTGDLHNVMEHASVIISRAGSGTIHEIALHGKPAILIPIPEDVSHDQRTNAYAYARASGAVVIEEKNLHDDLLSQEIDRIIQDPAVQEDMCARAYAFARTDAATVITQRILEIAAKH